MAAVGRAEETIIVNDNIYDNNSKEINPEMVRAVMAALIESNFNLVDDVLKSLNYDTGITLEEKLNQGGFLASGTVVLGNMDTHIEGQTLTVTGDFATATVTTISSGTDSLYTVTFNDDLSTNNYMVIAAIRSNKITFNDDNDVLVSTFKNPSIGSFQFSTREISVNANNITVYFKIVAM